MPYGVILPNFVALYQKRCEYCIEDINRNPDTAE